MQPCSWADSMTAAMIEPTHSARRDKERIVKVGVACGGPVSAVPENSADQGQVLARHHGLTGGGMAQVMQAKPAGLRVGAYRPPARREAPIAPTFGGSREQERLRLSGTGQRLDERPRPRRAAPRAGQSSESSRFNASSPILRQRRSNASLRRHPVSASSRIAATVSGQRGFVGVERAPEPGQFVRAEEPGDLLPGVLRDAETRVGVPLAQVPFLGPEHHRAQEFPRAVGRAGLVPARRVESRGHVLGADGIERHPAEGGQDAGLEIDAHGPAPRGLPVGIAPS